MAYAPIALTIPQYDKTSLANWWLKAYEQGTVTALNMATDAAAGTLLAKCEIDSEGFPITAGSARFIPFINGDYDLWCFPTELEADEDTTTNAIQFADNLNTDPSKNSVITIENVVDLKLFEGEFDNQIANLQSYYAGIVSGGQKLFWDATSTETPDDGWIFQVTGVVTGRWKATDTSEANVLRFGMYNNNTNVAINDAIISTLFSTTAYPIIYFPYGNSYHVTQITIDNNKTRVYGNNANILGVASVSTTSILEIKTGLGLRLENIVITGGQNQNYECGVHWYTNDLNTYFPGKATILDLTVNECLLGLCVGMLPSQSTYYAQGSVQAAGIATDAPLSENVISGLRTTDCISGLRVAQPNGKLTISGGYIAAEGGSWGAAPATTTWKALEIDTYGEVQIVNSSIEGIQSTDGSLIEMIDGNLTISDSILEGQSPMRFTGDARARFSHLGNYGFNSTSKPAILVHTAATGYAVFDNTWIVFPTANYSVGTNSLSKGVTDMTTEAYAEAPDFILKLSQVELRDVVERAGAAWLMANIGVKALYNDVTLTSFNGSNVKTKTTRLNNSKLNLLDGLVDQAMTTITAYPQAAGATVGGWTFAGTGTFSWGGQAPSATLNLETVNTVASTPSGAIRMSATTSNTCTATTPDFAVKPFDYLYITGWVKVGGTTSSVLAVKVNWKDDGAGAIATHTLTSGAGTSLEAGWQPFTCWAQQVSNGAKASLELYVENGVDVEWFGVEAFAS